MGALEEAYIKFNESIFKVQIGNMLIIGSTVLWGLDNNLSKIINKKMSVSRLVQLKSLIGAGLIFVITQLLGFQFDFDITKLIPIIVLAIGFAIPLYLYLHSMKRIGVVKSTSIASLSTVFGLLYANVFLHEQISSYQLVVIAIMLVGIYLMYRSEIKLEILPL